MAKAIPIVSIIKLAGVWHAVTQVGGAQLVEGDGPEEALAALVLENLDAFGLAIITERKGTMIPRGKILVEYADGRWRASTVCSSRTSSVRERAIGKILIECAAELNLEVRRKEPKSRSHRQK